MNPHVQRIEDLRSLMRARNWDAVIVTGSDPHCSEFPAKRWELMQWLSGFTGESGTLMVTLQSATLWTDSRFFIQARQQLEGSGVEFVPKREPDYDLPEGSVIALDGQCFNAQALAPLEEKFEIVSVSDFIDCLWTDRPCVPQTPVFEIDPGEGREGKIEWLRGEMAGKGCDGMLLSALDDIAWLLNVRASDIEYNPMVISYLLVMQDEIRWYVLKEDVEDETTLRTFDGLKAQGVEFRRYDEVTSDMADLAGRRIFADSRTLNYHLKKNLEKLDVHLLLQPSPVQLRKAVKNSVEIEGIRKAHLLDGIALEKFFFWLERSLMADRQVSEWDAAVKLGTLRNTAEGYTGDSFPTISAYGPSAALPHYSTPSEGSRVLKAEGLYLVDSGAQYEFGTTDVTRTMPLGPCSQLEMEDYTLVLKGHIDMEMAVFPKGTPGCRLDILLREPLWRHFRSFSHGGGHGVGYFLGVHEGPQEFRQNVNPQPFLPGMTVSDEPGLYREDMHGIRHENMILCIDAGENEFGDWLCFEPLTLCHFDTSAILPQMLDSEQREWLNEYNANVCRTLTPYLTEEEAAWLRDKTAAI